MAFHVEPPAATVLVARICEAGLEAVQSAKRPAVGIDEAIYAEQDSQHPFIQIL